MHLLLKAARRFGSDTRATTAIEYALIASGISVAIAAAVTTLGGGVKTTFYDKLAALF
jgi:Flp pilus assembly pilin Flp